MPPERPRLRLGRRGRALAAAMAFAFASTWAGSTAWAQTLLYVCTDSAGHSFSEAYPPPECKNRDVRVLNPDGSLKKVIPAPLTREQRKARDVEEEKQRKEQEEERKQADRDRSLLETYASVEEIEEARKRALGRPRLQIERADQKTVQLQRERKRLDDEAEFYAKRERPLKLKEAFDTNDALMKQQDKSRSDASQEIERINEHYNADKKRFQELEEMAKKAAEERERAEREAEQSSR